MSTSSVPTVLDALCDGLQALPGLTTVHVWSAPQGEYSGENIVLGWKDFAITEEPMGLGSTSRQETYSIPGSIWVATPGPDERPARDRAYELLGLVESYLNTTVPNTIGGACMDGELSSHELSQSPYEGGDYKGRCCRIDFNVDVTAVKVP